MLTSFSEKSENQVVPLSFQFALLDRARRELKIDAKFSEIYGAVFELWANRVRRPTRVKHVYTCHFDDGIACLRNLEIFGLFRKLRLSCCCRAAIVRLSCGIRVVPPFRSQACQLIPVRETLIRRGIFRDLHCFPKSKVLLRRLCVRGYLF